MARFVIADDSMVMRTILQFMLEKCGHAVVGAARDGLEAVDLFQKHKPDALALDILMRGEGGLTALKAIRKVDLAVVVFMISEEGQEREVQECLDAGALGVFRKPLILEQVAEELRKVFGG
jgi:two-component system, chemotaxis family, chemotaxis protein CheY